MKRCNQEVNDLSKLEEVENNSDYDLFNLQEGNSNTGIASISSINQEESSQCSKIIEETLNPTKILSKAYSRVRSIGSSTA
mmetsp:Transcript_20117/g.17817  ORF Transcript_20117/g.17817 Transcript_20117/m.17817 type:complete len:81 (-) Transcript_20117:614-856(-)